MKWYEQAAQAKEPTAGLLEQLARVLAEAEHKNVAGHMLAGFLWACYPGWYDEHLRKRGR